MKTKTARNILLFLLAVLGVGAIFGGGLLIISPSGKLFRMPLSMLAHLKSRLINLLIYLFLLSRRQTLLSLPANVFPHIFTAQINALPTFYRAHKYLL